jgi:hypothetical protein
MAKAAITATVLVCLLVGALAATKTSTHAPTPTSVTKKSATDTTEWVIAAGPDPSKKVKLGKIIEGKRRHCRPQLAPLGRLAALVPGRYSRLACGAGHGGATKLCNVPLFNLTADRAKVLEDLVKQIQIPPLPVTATSNTTSNASQSVGAWRWGTNGRTGGASCSRVWFHVTAGCTRRVVERLCREGTH